MVHTAEDYSSQWKTEKVHPILDVGELAARIWSPNTWNRQGNVLFMDSFEEGVLNWKEDDNGGAGSVAISTDRSRTGGSSVKLVTSGNGETLVGMSKGFVTGYDGKIGVEFHVLTEDEDIGFRLTVYIYDGTNMYDASILWVPASNTFYYMDSAQSGVALSTSLYAADDDETWVPIKLVVDMENMEYMNARVGNTSFDLSGEGLHSTAAGTEPNFAVLLEVLEYAADPKTGYIDDVIITQNEV